LIDTWKLKLITSRAKRRGLRGVDLEDAQQTLVLELLGFVFDPAKSNGATEATALVAVIDRRLAMMRRGERRHVARTERFKESLGQAASDEGSHVPHTNLSLDVRAAVADLPPVAQQICNALAEGQSVNEIARQLGMQWRAVRKQIDSISAYFVCRGLVQPPESRGSGKEIS
ncbi:MAG: hypothetical protein RIS70_3962, partial [Planctomycetota bacterium]